MRVRFSVASVLCLMTLVCVVVRFRAPVLQWIYPPDSRALWELPVHRGSSSKLGKIPVDAANQLERITLVDDETEWKRLLPSATRTN